ncbi:MAG: nickel transporter [Alphaproteobacteria bacterium]|nr:nickel transporter [Alphaproteobacteria bacterium]
MQVIPVIDLKGGQVVHARAGQRAQYRPIETPLSPTSLPSDVIAGLLRLFPFPRFYVADLDAIQQRGTHDAVLPALQSMYRHLEFWVDNGTSDPAGATAWLRLGLGQLVLGSESQRGTECVRAVRDDPRIVLSLDFDAHGFRGPPALLQHPELWPADVIVMTLARVGGSAGPDLERLAEFRRRAPRTRLYAAGGVRNAADLRSLAELGVTGALVATALHGGDISAADLERLARP